MLDFLAVMLSLCLASKIAVTMLKMQSLSAEKAQKCFSGRNSAPNPAYSAPQTPSCWGQKKDRKGRMGCKGKNGERRQGRTPSKNLTNPALNGQT